MKTKSNFDNRLLMGLLVFGSVLSMIVSSAFTTAPAFAATLAQSGAGPTMSSITPGSLVTQDLSFKQIKDKHEKEKSEKADDNTQEQQQTPVVTEVAGQLSGLVVTPTRASFAVGGTGARMDANLINGFSFSNGDWVTVEGYYLGPNNTGTFLVTEIDNVP